MDVLKLGPLPTSATPVDITLVRKTHYHSTCDPLNRLLAERQFHPEVVVGKLEERFRPGDFDIALVGHGVVFQEDRVARRQALPFASLS